jgi:hypothetical protein
MSAYTRLFLFLATAAIIADQLYYKTAILANKPNRIVTRLFSHLSLCHREDVAERKRKSGKERGKEREREKRRRKFVVVLKSIGRENAITMNAADYYAINDPVLNDKFM